MLGGLTSAVYDVVEIMDASGKDVIIVETVGVGQAEVDVIKMDLLLKRLDEMVEDSESH